MKFKMFIAKGVAPLGTFLGFGLCPLANGVSLPPPPPPVPVAQVQEMICITDSFDILTFTQRKKAGRQPNTLYSATFENVAQGLLLKCDAQPTILRCGPLNGTFHLSLFSFNYYLDPEPFAWAVGTDGFGRIIKCTLRGLKDPGNTYHPANRRPPPIH